MSKNRFRTLVFYYGMQLMVLEYAKNVLKLKDAVRRINPRAKDLVIGVMNEQREKIANKKWVVLCAWGSIQLAWWPVRLLPKQYKAKETVERHRHRYEVNPAYVATLQKGLRFSGTSRRSLDGNCRAWSRRASLLCGSAVSSQNLPLGCWRHIHSLPLLSKRHTKVICNCL